MKLDKQKISFTIKEKLTIFLAPSMFCILIIILVNIRENYQITALLTLPGTPLIDSKNISLKKFDPALRKSIARQYLSSQKQVTFSQQQKIAMIQTDQFILQFIEKFQLKPLLFAEQWDSEHQTWQKKQSYGFRSLLRRIFNPNEDLQIANEYIPKDYLVVKKFKKSLFVQYNNQNNLMKVTLRWPDAKQGSMVLSNWITFTNDYFYQQKKQDLILRKSRLIEQKDIKKNIKITKLIDILLADIIQQEQLNNPILYPEFKTFISPRTPEEQYFHFPKSGVLVAYIIGLTLSFLLVIIRKLRQKNKEKNLSTLEPNKFDKSVACCSHQSQ
ncbi:hypothetical protein [Aliikangiella maris]|uniref:Polysaccharide chain length determinant N-terminal domain-containing protein n=2 Tax=Aliikangiella maris TaxID=3162458 RepID=A0ABV2BSU3_9GAMM